MGQYFDILAPHERLALPQTSKFGCIIFFENLLLWPHLIKPVVPEHFGKDENDKHRSPSAEDQGSLARLPVEIQYLIMEAMEMTDVFFLGLVNEYWWNMARPLLARFFASRLGRLAGKALVSRPDELEYGDNPPALLADEESTKLADMLDEEDRIKHYGTKDLTVDRAVTMHLKKRSHELRGFYRPLPQSLYNLFASHLFCEMEEWGIDNMPTQAIKAAANPDIEDFIPPAESWVLRNLTAHEYVRSEAFGPPEAFLRQSEVKHPCVDDIIFSRINWASCGWRLVCDDEAAGQKVARGVWAGHRFDLIPGEQFTPDDDGHTWTDVTAEAKDEVDHIWARERTGQRPVYPIDNESQTSHTEDQTADTEPESDTDHA